MSGSKTPSENLRPHLGRAGRRLLLAAFVLAVLLIPSALAAPGALDPSFGTGGKVTTAIGSYDAYANALVRQPDGKLVAAGSSVNVATLGDFALARYNPNGSLDTSFNGTGKVTTAIGPGNDYAYALAVQPDGKLVVAGRSYNGSNDDLALARYNPNGSLDTSFNGTGKVTTAIGAGDDSADALALQPDGKIVAAGYSYNGSAEVFTLARYNPNGSLDTSFNGTGKVTTAIGDYADAHALVLQPDGKLAAAGIGHNGSQFVFALARYNPNGSLDTSFNGTGKVTSPIGSVQDNAIALARQPDGKLVAAGYSYNGPRRFFALARYNANGSLDTSFNGTGKLTTAIGLDDQAYDLALQPDGKIVAAGFSWNGSQQVFALARYSGSALTVAKTGTGSGSITSSPSGISCGSTCSAPFAAVPVTLTATPAAGSSFFGWSGACAGTGSCTLTMSGDRVATARFETNKTLALTKTGSGTGTVTSGPAGISCGSTCAHVFRHGTAVTLTPTASTGSSFAGWSGACSGTGSCTVTMSANRVATARFGANKTLALTKPGSGTGSVTSSPAGLNCGSTCAHAFKHGTAVTLTAIASAGSRFAGWSGACAGTGSCSLTMSAARSVTATFKVLCVVPKLKGKTLRAAKRAIRKAHCSVGKVTKGFSAKVKKGHVIAQKTKSGKKLAAGAKVKFTVSKGKKA
jgi:uncharacterized delta-60 repeat protein